MISSDAHLSHTMSAWQSWESGSEDLSRGPLLQATLLLISVNRSSESS